MAYLFVKHTVNDFNHWKTVYDSVATARDTHGAIRGQIMRDASNAKLVVVLEEYHTLEGAKNWAASSELRVAMGHAGVTSIPEIAFLEHLD